MKINVGIYDSEVSVYFTDDIEKTCRRKGIDYDGESAMFLYDDKDVGTYSLILPRGVDIYLLAHECTHLAMVMLNHHGIKVDVANDEPLAYLTGYLSNEIYKKQVKLKKR